MLASMPNLAFLGNYGGKDYGTSGSSGRPDLIALNWVRKYYGLDKAQRIISGYRRSVVTTDALITDFMKLNDVSYKDIDWKHPSIVLGFETAKQQFTPKDKLHPVHYCDVFEYPFPEDTSAEEPYRTAEQFTEYSTRKRDCKDHCFEKGRNDLHQIKEGHPVRIYDILANARSHLVLANEDDKIRMVYGYPFRELTFEAMFYWPYYSALTNGDHITMWGREMYNGGMRHLNKLMSEDETYFCLDWKSFDKKAQSSLIDKAFDIVFDCFDTSTYHKSPIYGSRHIKNGKVRMGRVMNHIRNFFKHGPVRLPGKKRFKRNFAGVPSGSMFTQLIDSIVNAIMINTICVEVTGQLPKWLRVLGDDSVFGLITAIDDLDLLKSEFANAARELFGAELNVSKSVITKDRNEVTMLGYRNNNGLPDRDIDDLLARFVHPENNPGSSANRKGRCVGLAWASIGKDPIFIEMMKAAYSEMKDVEINERELRYFNTFTLGIPADHSGIPGSAELVSRLMGTMPL